MWLADGSFFRISDRSGWRHLYHYGAPDGALIKQVTSGKWEVRTLHGVDESRGWVYFSGTERSASRRRRVPDQARRFWDASACRRRRATHTATFSPTMAYYVDTWSNVTTPAADPATPATAPMLRVLESRTRLPRLNEPSRLSQPELLQVKTRDGSS